MMTSKMMMNPGPNLNMELILRMKLAELNLVNQIVKMNGGGPNSESKMRTQDYNQLESHPLEKIHTPIKFITGIYNICITVCLLALVDTFI